MKLRPVGSAENQASIVTEDKLPKCADEGHRSPQDLG